LEVRRAEPREKLGLLRSWVQISPGPSFTTRELRYYIELILGDCRINLAAMPIELCFTLQGDLRTSQTLQEALRDISLL
jgi:hypothetical protein